MEKLFDEYPERAKEKFIEMCIEINSLAELKELIKLGFDLRDYEFLDRAFVNSCASDSIDIPLFFLDEGANINANNGQALVRTVRYKQWDNFQMLLNRGIEMTPYNISQILYQPGYKKALEMLLAHGINKQLVTKLLFEGLIKNTNHKDSINFLINNGADLNNLGF